MPDKNKVPESPIKYFSTYEKCVKRMRENKIKTCIPLRIKYRNFTTMGIKNLK
tara:strand:+ start:577 stop:735 length:159 start_codon:yes stop_codon:yes gene_type:complete